MNKPEILERVKKTTGRVLGLELEEIQESSNFVFDLGAESTQSVELIAAFEDEFGIDMDQEAALAVQTVGGAAEHIARYVK